MVRSALLILSGNALASLLGLVRNLVLARLLGIEDYGIAATFAISLAVVEMLSELGLRQMIVQDRQGDDPRLQATLQGFQLLRAAISATALFLLAHPLAGFLGIPEVAWAYQVMALVPLLNGITHFDLNRVQRRMQFLPAVLGKTAPALASVLLVWPLFLLFGDYRVMLYAILAQWVLTAVASHLLAERPFQLGLDPAILRRSLRFGWPILVTAVLLFLVFHGEKLVVGRLLGMETLAIFAMGLTLSLTPILVLTGSLNTFFLPQLSAAQDDAPRFNRIVRLCLEIHVAIAVAFALLLAWAGPAIVALLLGERFAALGPLMLWLGLVVCVRFIRGTSELAAFSLGRTTSGLLGNLPRAAAMPVMWYALVETGSLTAMLWIAFVGELCGLALTLLVLRRQPIAHLRPLLPTLAVGLGALACVAAAGLAALLPAAPEGLQMLAHLLAVALFAVNLMLARELRAHLGRLLGRG